MANKVYFVTALTDPAAVADRLKQVVPDDSMRHQLALDKWFVAFDGIANELAEKLGIRTESPVATGIVLAVTTFSGRAPQTIWDWLTLRTNSGS